MTTNEAVAVKGDWKPTACILCECNCGIEVRLGHGASTGDATSGEPLGLPRRFERIRGDKAHPASKGYTCEKALRLDHYQNATFRITSPLRRRADGSYEAIDWETAIREVADGFKAVRDTHGGESIFYYGGGGQGNHLGGSYSGATLRALGARYKANALSQEKTGEFWVNAKMLAANVRGDFEHTEVAVFVGKNPWQSHGMPHARTTLKEISADPERSMIVIDPRKTETADLADFHLQVKPGTDAWCLAALGAVIVQEGLVKRSWVDQHTGGYDDVAAALGTIPIADYARICGVDEELLRGAARRIAGAASVAVFEDLGVQMSLHSTLCSYLEKLVWLLTGNFGKAGAQYAPTSLVSLVRGMDEGRKVLKTTPVVGAKIISGLVPCNVVPDEILTDHPARYRAMLVESGNPAHSIADSQRMREALGSLELLVVIDVAMTETARLAHYVLPAQSQYEKYEATFFNFDFPKNVFHLRRPVVEPLPGTLPEPEIHARLVEALGAMTDEQLAPLRAAAATSRAAFAEAFFAATTADPALGALAPVVLYRTLGPTLPDGAASAAILWGASHRCALSFPESLKRADACVLTRADLALPGPGGIEELKRRVRAVCGAVIAVSRHRWAGVHIFENGMLRSAGAGELQGKRVVACCAIGNPGAFFEQVKNAGAEVCDHVALSDHDPFDGPTWTGILEKAKGTDGVILTEKDWVKVRRHGDLLGGTAVWYTSVEIEVLEGEADLWGRVSKVFERDFALDR